VLRPLEAGPVETLESVVSPGCMEGALTRVRTTKMREPRNPINDLLAPQDLVGLFKGYQSRPKAKQSTLEFLAESTDFFGTLGMDAPYVSSFNWCRFKRVLREQISATVRP
jgi:hypothetical protein